MKSKQQLIDDLNTIVQERGNLTVLFTNSISEQIGLSATEFECLDVIGNNQPITAGYLAVLTGISTGGITGIIDRLEKAGFVHRERDTVDRRRVLLTQLSDPATIQKIRKLYQPMAQKFDDLCRDLSAEELTLILRYERLSTQMVRELLDYSRTDKSATS